MDRRAFLKSITLSAAAISARLPICSLQELVGHEGCTSVALTRAGKAALPTPDMTVEAGDVLHVSATFEGVEAVRRQLAQSRQAKEA